ncbi:MAG: tRNA 2-thiouridine(34) synthase MnmA [Chloroflexota bacterium]|nr:tRNA 2-thiouridine(34) synthase MnmA [Chloroflexota bacterium]
MATVVVAMSGGVDSSVAAAVLKDQGHDVIGVNLRLYSKANADAYRLSKQCCTLDSMRDAEAVCRRIGVPFYALNMEREFANDVVEYFVGEYVQGRTPNPCVACNAHIKFKHLFSRALALGADYIATGHYARVHHTPEGARLLTGVDPDKDQSYALYMLGPGELSRTLLPIGEQTKTETRRLAAEFGLVTAKKPESQDICFIPDGDYRSFVRKLAPQAVAPGPIKDSSGRELGRHQGVAFYTVGQRKGLGVQGPQPLYVTRVDARNNTVVVGRKEELASRRLVLEGVSFTDGRSLSEPLETDVKLRYRGASVPAVLTPVVEGRVDLELLASGSVSPGQAVVFYRGEEVLGGGKVASA